MDTAVATTQASPPINPLITGDPGFDSLPVSHRILLSPPLMESVQNTAKILSQARGFVSHDLIGKTETCFAVAVTAFETGLNPFFLAQGAFQTPEGKVGFDTRRIQAVVESKNLFSKAPKPEYSGPWDNLIGKFRKEKSQKKGPNGQDKWYTAKTWGADDAKGCKLKITYYFRDREEPEEFEMDLAEVGTFFSTSWATEPKNQFYNLVFRRGLNQKRASALAGTPAYDDLIDEGHTMKEVNERPAKRGNAGLDAFAGEPKVTDAVVQPEVVTVPQPEAKAEKATETKAETVAEVKPEPEAKTAVEDKPTAEDKPDDGKVTIWASPDEPKRELTSISNAVFVLRNLIKDSSTAPGARTIFHQNMDVIGNAGDDASRDLEQELERRIARNGGSGASGINDAANRQSTLV